ncbi:MAG: PA0069 family radical SAM protein [Tepidisphaeraceae bacterium]
MNTTPLNIHGRGAADNPPNRFEPISVESNWDEVHPDEMPRPRTQYLRDVSRTIIAHNDSPDVGFEYSINPYRGCEHGCIYCYARPTHEYFGLSAGLDFETMIFVKLDGPELLRRELMNEKWLPRTISISGVTDCYQPIERQLEITRRCLQVLAEFRNPVGVVTKKHLVTRDIDILRDLSRDHAAMVFVSVTTLDPDLAAKMEPRTSTPKRRLEAIQVLSDAGVPVGVFVAPLIPGLNDHEMPAILEAAGKAGAVTCGYVPLRLPGAVAGLFEDWLSRHFPDRRDKVLNRIRSIRSGKLNDSDFHSRMRGQGVLAEQFQAMFDVAKRRCGLDRELPGLSAKAFRRPRQQLNLF